MSSLRFQALEALNAGEEKKITGYGDKKITAIYGSNVFSGRTAREYLSDEAYKSLVNSAKSGSRVERRMARCDTATPACTRRAFIFAGSDRASGVINMYKPLCRYCYSRAETASNHASSPNSRPLAGLISPST